MAKSFAFGINHEWEWLELNQDKKEEKKNYFEKYNINVFNKLIKIVDIDHREVKDYLVHNQGQKIIAFKDLRRDNVKDDFCLSKEINYDSYNDITGVELPVHYNGKFKKRLAEFLENNKMKG